MYGNNFVISLIFDKVLDVLRYLANFFAIMRYLSIFFAVLRYSEPPNVPLIKRSWVRVQFLAYNFLEDFSISLISH